MAQYRIPDPEELLECPYDKVHMVRAKRFQYHLMKCRKNYKGKEYSSCPFNAKHELPKPEMRHHLSVCPDRAVIEPELSYAQRKATGQDTVMKGCTDTPVYNDIVIPATEDWDAEAGPPVRVGPMHDPTYHSRVVFKDLSSHFLFRVSNRSDPDEMPSYSASHLDPDCLHRLNKDQRAVMRDNRLTTDQKMTELHAYSNTREASHHDMEENLRLPKTASITAIQPKPQPKEQPVSSVFAYSIGRGRGRGQFKAPEPVGAPEAFTPAYGRGMAMGIGRGLAPGMGRGDVAPPPGFCVPNVNERNQN